jgi:hypothetical protein
VTFEVEVDWLPFADAVEAKGYKDRVGEVIYDWYGFFLIAFPACLIILPFFSLSTY